MGPRLVFVLSVLLVLCCAVSGSDFDDSNPIFMVSDTLRELESEVVRVIGRTPHALRFARFAHRYGKKYATTEEMKRRYEIFLESLELIKSTNRKGLSYKLGVNQFADWTWEEFKQRRLLKEPKHYSANSTSSLKLTHGHRSISESKDWRDEGIVSPVKDQGSCGACWAFSATGALEAAYAQIYGEQISLSEQQLLDCSGDFNNFGCKGGIPSRAFEYVEYNGGIVKESDYPYTAVRGDCKYPRDKIAAKVYETHYIRQEDEEELLFAVSFHGPVSVGFKVDGGFRLYKEGVYSSATCGSTLMDVNHAVLAVGYGVEDDEPYWLLKNSWGADWGDHGYFKMLKGVNMCGVATCASYPFVV